MESQLKSTFTRDQVLEVIFYCFFNIEQSLSEAFRAKLKHIKFFEEMYLKEEEKKNKEMNEKRRRLARAGRDALTFGLSGLDNSGYNLGQFIDAVRNHMQFSKEVNNLSTQIGLDRKGNNVMI